jgi:hypothetical protein
MTALYLTDDWFDLVAASGSALPRHEGLDCTIDIEVAGAPAGKVRYHEVWSDGRLVTVEGGAAAEADVKFVLKYADAVALVAGDVSADVAFMQGRFKIDGAYDRWLFGFRPVVSSDAYRAYLAAVAEQTSFDEGFAQPDR